MDPRKPDSIVNDVPVAQQGLDLLKFALSAALFVGNKRQVRVASCWPCPACDGRPVYWPHPLCAHRRYAVHLGGAQVEEAGAILQTLETRLGHREPKPWTKVRCVCVAASSRGASLLRHAVFSSVSLLRRIMRPPTSLCFHAPCFHLRVSDTTVTAVIPCRSWWR